MIQIVFSLAILIILIEGIPLFLQRKWPELITAGVLISISLFVVIGKTWGMPTPLEYLARLLFPIGKAIFKQF